MSSSEASTEASTEARQRGRRVVESLLRQKAAFAGLLVLCAGQLGAMAALKAASVDLGDQFYARRLVAIGEPASLPVTWNLPRLSEHKHTFASGFQEPEDWGVWTSGPQAKLIVRLAEPAPGDLLLTAKVAPFVNEKLTWQGVRVLVNSRQVDRWRFQLGDGVSERTVRIPAEVAARENPLRITFAIENPASRRQLRIDKTDKRQLGVAFHALSLVPAR